MVDGSPPGNSSAVFFSVGWIFLSKPVMILLGMDRSAQKHTGSESRWLGATPKFGGELVFWAMIIQD